MALKTLDVVALRNYLPVCFFAGIVAPIRLNPALGDADPVFEGGNAANSVGGIPAANRRAPKAWRNAVEDFKRQVVNASMSRRGRGAIYVAGTPETNPG
jgi:hypothetical protein